MPAANVATDAYQSMSCSEISKEARGLHMRKESLRPALFSSKNEQERERELGQVNGEINALETVSTDKNCGRPK